MSTSVSIGRISSWARPSGRFLSIAIRRRMMSFSSFANAAFTSARRLAIDLAVLGRGRVLLEHLLLDRVDRVLALQLRLDLGGLVELAPWEALDRRVELLVDLRRLDLDLLLAGLPPELLHRAAELLDLRVRDVERVEDLGLGDAIGAGLDHQDRLLGPRDDQVHVELLERLLLGVDDEVTLELPDSDRADVLGDRDLGDRERRGGAVHRQDVVRVDVVHRHRLGDQLGLAVPALREQRAQWAVDHPRGQGGLLAGPCLAAEE